MMPLLVTLTGNEIGDAGATQLADALHRNSTLTTLDLGGKHDKIYVVIISNVLNICDTYCFLFIYWVCFFSYLILLSLFL